MLDLGDSGHCLGYVAGALDAFVSFQTWRPSKVNQLCIPDAVAMAQSVKIVMKYVDAHPEELHLPAPDIIWAALFRHESVPSLQTEELDYAYDEFVNAMRSTTAV
jgi:hypothetical protein